MTKPLAYYPSKTNDDAAFKFDEVLDDARQKRIDAHIILGTPPPKEPDFCHGLITSETIKGLNRAAARVYDPTHNVVRFYGGLVHNQPIANFQAEKHGTSVTEERGCELADLLIVLVRSEPDPKTGMHRVTEKRACLVQAKMGYGKDGSKMFGFVPKGVKYPGKKSSNEKQLYLLQEWPNFTLNLDGHKAAYNLRGLKTNTAGKYCQILSESGKKKLGTGWKGDWDHHWKYSEPKSNVMPSGTLGSMIDSMANLDHNIGADYYLHSNTSVVDRNWSCLIDNLVDHCHTEVYAGASREANPSRLRLSSFVSNVLPEFYTSLSFLQQSRPNAYSQKIGYYLESRISNCNVFSNRHSTTGLPIIFISVNSKKPPDTDEIVKVSKQDAIEAAERIFSMYEYYRFGFLHYFLNGN